MPADSAAAPLVSLAAAAVTACAACAGAYLARGSTAVPAAWWACGAAVAAGAEAAARAAGGLADPASQTSARLAVSALAVCPIMSLLGAKRPQHGVWQFIVATLAAVLALPAATATLVRPGSLPDVHPLQRWFMLVVAIVAGLNFVATRHGLAAVAIVAAQATLMRTVLPFGSGGSSPIVDAIAAAVVAGGAVAAVVQSAVWPAGRSKPGAAEVSGAVAADVQAALGPAYLALRETLGAAWALRIAERFNAEAASAGWPCRLSFDGLHVDGDPGDRHWQADAIRTGRALLRRFVSTEWIGRHGAKGEKAGKRGVQVASHPGGG